MFLVSPEDTPQVFSTMSASPSHSLWVILAFECAGNRTSPVVISHPGRWSIPTVQVTHGHHLSKLLWGVSLSCRNIQEMGANANSGGPNCGSNPASVKSVHLRAWQSRDGTSIEHFWETLSCSGAHPLWPNVLSALLFSPGTWSHLDFQKKSWTR